MRASVRPFLLAALLFAPELGASALHAQSLYLPSPPTGPGGEDTIETEGGVRCRQSMNSNGAYMDVGVTGTTSNADSRGTAPYGPSYFPQAVPFGGQQATGYARITLPLGHRPQRIDCSRIYEMEIARMKRELELLKMAAQE